jgi:uncharacterized damage-inducible protein DinB
MYFESNPLMKRQVQLWRRFIKANLTEALEKTPEDKLDFIPAKDMIPLGKIFLHIAEVSDWWYDDFMKGKPGTELATMDSPTPTKEEVTKHMEEHWERMERFFAEPEEVFKKSYQRKLGKRTIEYDGWWVFSHMLEHDIHHRCQIHQYLRILGIKPPEL